MSTSLLPKLPEDHQQRKGAGTAPAARAPRGAAGGRAAADLGNTRTVFPRYEEDTTTWEDPRDKRYTRRSVSSKILIKNHLENAREKLISPFEAVNLDTGEIREITKNEAGTIRKMLPPRVARCGWALKDKITLHGGEGIPAHFGGTERCGSISACAPCSAVIRAERSAEISRAVKAHQEAGKEIVFATLTMRHDWSDNLSDLLDALFTSWTSLLSGRFWVGDSIAEMDARLSKRARDIRDWQDSQRIAAEILASCECDVPEGCEHTQTSQAWRTHLKRPRQLKNFVRGIGLAEEMGIVGSIRSVEITRGKSGWHPHIHALFFIDRKLTDTELIRFEDRIFEHWRASLVAHDPLFEPTRQRGIDFQKIDQDGDVIAKYLSKIQEEAIKPAAVSLEMARADLKKSKNSLTPFELLDDPKNAALWIEFFKATKGRRIIEWSRGLKSLFLIGDKSDDDIMDDTVASETVWVTSKKAYEMLRDSGNLHLALIAAESGSIAVLRMILPGAPPKTGNITNYYEK